MPTTSPNCRGTRKLVHLYTLNHMHGTGLGQALYESVIYPDENSYLWVMAENERALSFYERLGYQRNSIEFEARGIWRPATAYGTRASSTRKTRKRAGQTASPAAAGTARHAAARPGRRATHRTLNAVRRHTRKVLT